MANTSIRGAGRLVDCLIGREVEITRSDTAPRAARLMIGDHCQVDLG
jgi:glucose-1-phosphate thymidylyltransferase